MKIALSMIVAGHEQKEVVERCIRSVSGFVDGMFATITTKDENGLKEHLESLGVTVSVKNDFIHKISGKDLKWFEKFFGFKPMSKEGDNVFLFDKARNYALEQVPSEYDWFIWLDADDVVKNPERIKDVVKMAESKKAEAVFLNYLYQVELDENNNIKSIIIEHMRERILKNNDAYRWVAPIHETLIEQRPTIKVDSQDVEVIHLSHHERRMSAIYRNIRALELHIIQDKGHDPRPIYYLGKAYFDLRGTDDMKRAAQLFNVYLNGSKEYDYSNRSGWAEERCQCREYLLEVERALGNHDAALQQGMLALLEAPVFPSTYLNIAMSYAVIQRWDLAMHWVELGLKVKQPKTTLISNPKDQEIRAMEVIYHSALNMAQLDRAWAAATKLNELIGNEETNNRVRITTSLRTDRDLTQKALELARYLDQTGEAIKIRRLMQALPSNIQNNPVIADIRKRFTPPRTWDDKEIAIFCGPGFTPWSPKKLREPGGSFVGGSEEAVILLSEELQKQGWKVTVFGDPGEDEGEHNGVKYVNHFEMNLADTFNIFVAWRNPNLFHNQITAKKKYVWCHDIQNPLDYTKEILEQLDKVIVLSEWHRKNIPAVPDNKIMISKNGVTL